MSDKNNYSDEYLNAYIDGELDNDERAHLLFDEQKDYVLSQRITDARLLKEKVQLAYSDIVGFNIEKKPFICTDFFRRYRALVASLLILTAITSIFGYQVNVDSNVSLAKQLIKNTQPITANTIIDAIGTQKHIVINISQYQAENFTDTINNIEAILRQHKNDRLFSLEIVANKSGLNALDVKTSSHAKRMSELTSKYNNLEIVACAKSLANLATEGNPVQLMRSIIITPSAAQQVAKRTSEGWLYLKI